MFENSKQRQYTKEWSRKKKNTVTFGSPTMNEEILKEIVWIVTILGHLHDLFLNYYFTIFKNLKKIFRTFVLNLTFRFLIIFVWSIVITEYKFLYRTEDIENNAPK